MMIWLAVAALVLLGALFATIAERKARMSLASQLKAVQDDVAALKAAPASSGGVPTDDDSALQSQIDALSNKLDDLSTFVGSPTDLAPAAPAEQAPAEPAPAPITPN